MINEIIEQIIKRTNALDSRVSHLERLEQAMAADNRGWINGAWQKDPLRLGYSERIAMQWSNENLPAGNLDILSPTVPAGELWIITNLAFEYGGTPAPTQVMFRLVEGLDRYSLWGQLAPQNGAVFSHQGWWALKPGDRIAMRVTNATAGHYLRGYATGFRVDIDQ